MGYRATTGVSNEYYYLAVGRIEGVDHCNNRLNLVAQCDLGAVRVS
jgi:hypothetical protein